MLEFLKKFFAVSIYSITFLTLTIVYSGIKIGLMLLNSAMLLIFMPLLFLYRAWKNSFDWRGDFSLKSFIFNLLVNIFLKIPAATLLNILLTSLLLIFLPTAFIYDLMQNAKVVFNRGMHLACFYDDTTTACNKIFIHIQNSFKYLFKKIGNINYQRDIEKMLKIMNFCFSKYKNHPTLIDPVSREQARQEQERREWQEWQEQQDREQRERQERQEQVRRLHEMHNKLNEFSNHYFTVPAPTISSFSFSHNTHISLTTGQLEYAKGRLDNLNESIGATKQTDDEFIQQLIKTRNKLSRYLELYINLTERITAVENDLQNNKKPDDEKFDDELIIWTPMEKPVLLFKVYLKNNRWQPVLGSTRFTSNENLERLHEHPRTRENLKQPPNDKKGRRTAYFFTACEQAPISSYEKNKLAEKIIKHSTNLTF